MMARLTTNANFGGIICFNKLPRVLRSYKLADVPSGIISP